MAARRTWTDYEVAKLLNAMCMAYADGQDGDTEFVRIVAPFRTQFYQRVASFCVHTRCPDGFRTPFRQRLKKTVRALDRAYRRRRDGAITTPEDTLRDAGIDDTRQAAYQRKFSTLLSGRGRGKEGE